MSPARYSRNSSVVVSLENSSVFQEPPEGVRSNGVTGSQVHIAYIDRDGHFQQYHRGQFITDYSAAAS